MLWVGIGWVGGEMQEEEGGWVGGWVGGWEELLTLLQSSSQKQAYSCPHTSHSHMKGVGGRVGGWERDLPSFRVLPKSKRTAVLILLILI